MIRRTFISFAVALGCVPVATTALAASHSSGDGGQVTVGHAATTVENWTTKQWIAAKSEWAKDKGRWAYCQQQSTHQKLIGRKSWSFLYTCMTT